ncbi:hypothetical protein JFU48_25635 [Pseudomonas sp. TH49]|uniref:hypothetical protein n=1 Tax=Pseudomonas sp. TH49 TaxID=2796413 RepID=UPI001914758B|nr:hypothetical protein [Pseudomonas sp. TH49]MBK5344732.1 hypothetical protein [Pseudomonas sp. TH49]
MNAPSPPLYTNEVSAEFLRLLDNSPFTEQQLAGSNEQALATVNQQQAYTKSHPPIAIYRAATEGSQALVGSRLSNGEEISEVS